MSFQLHVINQWMVIVEEATHSHCPNEASKNRP